MKTILKLTCFLLFTIQVSCQVTQIKPLNYTDIESNGDYLKDLDGILPFWVGTWKGTVNNREYTFQFTKFTQHLTTFSSGRYFYLDELKAKFKVVDLSTNQVLYDDLNVTEFSDYKIRYLSNLYEEYTFHFRDTESNCNNQARFTLIKSVDNPNQIAYKDFKYDENIYECPYETQADIPMFLPKTNLVLIRQ
ncbi:hypothetical protein LXD69_06285 [Flavobacterium sediminilitoris]|uniref:Uncharacterized protein n=1 Tax=Flavobacterium sediminilitoris TaxID=2024526 RepID=A0ABY4HS26_9FLAO|nr:MULTISPECIES: hypothetical protein [Flavobacterium]UOX35117.1 hypothetical protein LXD69_06285 [Flavobacterium sediminilitoris]